MTLLDLTTTADVKTLLGKSKADHDTLIGEMVTDMSRRFEQELGRSLMAESQTEVFSVRQGQRIIGVTAVPMSALTSIKLSITKDFSGVAALTSNNDFVIDLAQGEIEFLFAPDTGYVEVAYTGGMAANTSAFKSAFPDIARACSKQVAYEFERRNRPNSSTTVEGANRTYDAPLGLLPDVQTVLDMNRRRYW